MSQENTDKSSEDLNLDLDFQMLPSWAKEKPGKNPYTEHSGQDARPRRDNRPGGRRDGRGGGRPGQRPGGGGPPGRGNRGRGGPGGGGGGPRREGGFGGDRRPRQDRRGRDGFQGRGDRRDSHRDRDRDQRGGDDRRRGFGRGPIPKEEQPEAYGVKISFLPVPACVQGVVNQLRSTRTASSLFAIAKLFLAKPERYLLRIKSLKSDRPLFQIGEDGPVAFERSQLEFAAFEKFADQFYNVEVRELEEIKGNFNNVARCRLSGELLGPTNHHSYQGKLRGLYEEKYRAEMPFERFRQQVEVVNDPEVVEKWKEEARKQTIYSTKDEENPKTFSDKAEARQHFLLNHAGQVIHKTHAVTVAGRDSRMIPDADIQKAMRSAFEMEIRFPNRLAQALRSEFMKAGLHVFKHRKRMLYVWTFRPRLLQTSEDTLAPGVRGILHAVKAKPGLNLHELAVALIPELKEFEGKENPKPGPEIEEKKNELAGYLHYLVSEGHVIEFQDGTLEFPLPPKDQRQRGKRDRDQKSKEPKGQKPQAPSRPDVKAEAEAEGEGKSSPESAEKVTKPEEKAGENPQPDDAATPIQAQDAPEPTEKVGAPSESAVDPRQEPVPQLQEDQSNDDPAKRDEVTEKADAPATDQSEAEPDAEPKTPVEASPENEINPTSEETEPKEAVTTQ